MNMVALIGNTASDPDVRTTPAGRKVASFRLAVPRPGGEVADFFTIVAWERQAELVEANLTTGRRIGVEGRLHYTSGTLMPDGHSKVEVVANRIQLLGKQ